ncbi:MAG: aldo/keto reductase [Candidatus Tectimicrobiota bacterium]|nr:MAG: aldo/keto reductase [Candidatus Tectomicrobia bacterium]
MEYKPLGNTGVLVPEIGLGTWRYRGGVEPLRHGIALGARLIDTAEIYGTEEVVGEALRDCREQVFLATKVSAAHLRYDDVLRAAEASLRRLGTSVIDLYQIHWPNPRVPIAETLRAMETLVDRGQVRFLGVSNFSLQALQQAQAAARHHPIVSNQVLYNLNRRDIERELLPYCQQQGITVIAYTPLDDGRLAVPSSQPRMQVLAAVAREVNKTLAQVALNWCIAHPNVIAIPKSNRRERIEENCGASGWRLSAAQLERLNAAFS